ncbi:hypothetical protein [Algicola sagamiensis]|uniref:hypothetical protein n=1 Tax=Algicola sagamiensis TaxID=163869 RepID=UPI000360C9EA|nr:hypothetical protein [Algicola sagamiensis]
MYKSRFSLLVSALLFTSPSSFALHQNLSINAKNIIANPVAQPSAFGQIQAMGIPSDVKQFQHQLSKVFQGIYYRIDQDKKQVTRYDLASKIYLDPINTHYPAMDMVVNESGLYFAVGNGVVRTSYSNPTGEFEMVYRADERVDSIFIDENYLIASIATPQDDSRDENIIVIDTRYQDKTASLKVHFDKITYSSENKTILLLSDDHLMLAKLNDEGRFIQSDREHGSTRMDPKDLLKVKWLGNRYGKIEQAHRYFSVTKDKKHLITWNGIVYRSDDLGFVADLSRPVEDVVYHNQGVFTSYANVLQGYNTHWAPDDSLSAIAHLNSIDVFSYQGEVYQLKTFPRVRTNKNGELEAYQSFNITQALMMQIPTIGYLEMAQVNDVDLSFKEDVYIGNDETLVSYSEARHQLVIYRPNDPVVTFASLPDTSKVMKYVYLPKHQATLMLFESGMMYRINVADNQNSSQKIKFFGSILESFGDQSMKVYNPSPYLDKISMVATEDHILINDPDNNQLVTLDAFGHTLQAYDLTPLLGEEASQSTTLTPTLWSKQSGMMSFQLASKGWRNDVDSNKHYIFTFDAESSLSFYGKITPSKGVFGKLSVNPENGRFFSKSVNHIIKEYVYKAGSFQAYDYQSDFQYFGHYLPISDQLYYVHAISGGRFNRLSTLNYTVVSESAYLPSENEQFIRFVWNNKDLYRLVKVNEFFPHYRLEKLTQEATD